MSGNIHVSDEVSNLYEHLQAKRDKLKEQLEAVEREFEAVSTTLKLMGLPTPGMSNLNLQGMSHIDALVAIAMANNGLLVVKVARRLMNRAGLFKNAKNASSILFTAINRCGKFERESAGKYKLVEQEEPQVGKMATPTPLVDLLRAKLESRKEERKGTLTGLTASGS